MSYIEGSEPVLIGDESEQVVAKLLRDELLYDTKDISKEAYRDFTSPFDIYAVRPDRTLLVDAKMRSPNESSLWLWKMSLDNKLEYSHRVADFKIIIFHIKDRFKAITVWQALSVGRLTSDGGMYILEHYMLTNLGKSLRHLDTYLDKIQYIENPDGYRTITNV